MDRPQNSQAKNSPVFWMRSRICSATPDRRTCGAPSPRHHNSSYFPATFVSPLRKSSAFMTGTSSARPSHYRPCGLALGFGLVQSYGGANERLQRLFIDLVALMDIDGASSVAFEAGVEEA